MIKQNKSWWKDSDIPDLIGRKKIDRSMLEFGTHIPADFHSDFKTANNGELPEVGHSHVVKLLYQEGITNISFKIELKHLDQHSHSRSSLHLRYDSNESFQAFLQSVFTFSLNYFLENMVKKNKGQRNNIIVPDEEAEYISFYMTPIPYTYRFTLSSFSDFKNQF